MLKKRLSFKQFVSFMLCIGLFVIYSSLIEIGLFAFTSHAATPEEQYTSATNSYESLKKSPERQKYRHNWLNCIQKFAAVYSGNPNHSLASSGMYHSAELYIGLYKISAIEKDKIEALDLLNRIIKRYPTSTDRDMAEKLLLSLKSKNESNETVNKSDSEKSAYKQEKAPVKNNQASQSNSNYKQSVDNHKSNNNVRNADSTSSNGNAYITDLRYWTTPDYTRVVINISDERRYVYQLLDENPSANQPQRLYLDIKKSLVGKDLPSHTRINDDLLLQARAGQYKDETVRVVVDIKSFGSYKIFSMKDPFRVIIDVWGNKSGKSTETSVVKIANGKDKIEESERLSENLKTSEKLSSKESEEVQGLVQSSESELDGLLKRSTKKSTKISTSVPIASQDISNAEKSITYSESDDIESKVSTKTATKSSYSVEESLSSVKETSAEEPPEIATETNTKGTYHLPVKKSLKASTMVLSDATRKLLRKSLAQSSEEASIKTSEAKERTVKKKDSKKIALKESYESDLEKYEEQPKRESSRKATKGTTRMVQIAPGSNVDRIKASSIAKQLALGVRTIVIDPGHGGRDPGASGYITGIYEKNVVLSISKKLAKNIESRLNCNVIMTRSSDTYLSLEERTAIANTKNADLFISLHCNASNDKNLIGIETYYLNLATDDRAINVAARENATSRKNISDLESILNDLMKNAKINESSRLSSVVQKSLYGGMKNEYSKIKNLGVKQAPFYVLLGASMPSILIETSFLSNPEECRRLTDSAYQNALCDAITDGIAKYIRETNPQRL
ncbi:MAG: N-acetylmuramoyl-L-alanine amidase [Desulfamplus sp.]|nr:N-acetylmuramoyl-L-alanine amidase [Desulfamplus sp.]